jgi:hypothetical protein
MPKRLGVFLSIDSGQVARHGLSEIDLYHHFVVPFDRLCEGGMASANIRPRDFVMPLWEVEPSVVKKGCEARQAYIAVVSAALLAHG